MCTEQASGDETNNSASYHAATEISLRCNSQELRALHAPLMTCDRMSKGLGWGWERAAVAAVHGTLIHKLLKQDHGDEITTGLGMKVLYKVVCHTAAA